MTENIESTWANKLVFLLLCAAIVWTTLLYGTVHPPVIALFYLTAALTAILWAVDGFSSGVFRFNKSLLQIPLLAISLYGFFQIIPFGTLATAAGVEDIPRTISLDPFWTKVSALHFLALFIFFAAFIAFTDTTARLKKIVWLITIFGFIYAFYAILQAVLSPNKIYGIYERQFASPFGSFVNRHNFAAFMEMTIAVPLGLMFAGAVEKDRRLLIMTAIGLMGIALILSGSRGGLVALLAQIFFLIILTTDTKSAGRTALKVGLSIALVAVIVAGSMMIGGESSLTRLAETSLSKDITTDRTHIWSVTLEVIKNNLPFGAGLGAFSVAYTPYDSMSGIERVEQAHNDYLQVLADAGIAGLIIGAFFLFWLFRTGLQSIFDFVLHTTAVSLLFLTLVSLVVLSGGNTKDKKEISAVSRKKRPPANIASIEEKRKKLDVS
jgi:O-antigen ligase